MKILLKMLIVLLFLSILPALQYGIAGHCDWIEYAEAIVITAVVMAFIVILGIVWQKINEL